MAHVTVNEGLCLNDNQERTERLVQEAIHNAIVFNGGLYVSHRIEPSEDDPMLARIYITIDQPEPMSMEEFQSILAVEFPSISWKFTDISERNLMYNCSAFTSDCEGAIIRVLNSKCAYCDCDGCLYDTLDVIIAHVKTRLVPRKKVWEV